MKKFLIDMHVHKQGSVVYFSLMIASMAQAQHTSPPDPSQGAYGVNRRVESGAGYGSLSGSFSEPDMSSDASFYNTDTVPNPYMGLGYAGIQIDAGLKYEARKQWVGASKTGKWQSFMLYTNSSNRNNITKSEKNGKDSTGADWSVPRNSLGSCDLTVGVSANGSALLTVTYGGNTLPDVSWPSVIPVTSAAAAGLYIKRVTAMTQAAGETLLNDTFMENSTFEVTNVSSVAVQGGNFVLTRKRPGLWDAPVSAGTGYAPIGRDGTGRFIIDFNAALKRNADGSDPNVAGRYSAPETVNISLRKGSGRVVGLPVRRGGRK